MLIITRISIASKQNSSEKVGGEIKRFAEGELIVGIPLVAGLRPVVVQPQAVLVPFELEDVRVAIRVVSVRSPTQVTGKRDVKKIFFPEFYSISRPDEVSSPDLYPRRAHQVFLFFSFLHATLIHARLSIY